MVVHPVGSPFLYTAAQESCITAIITTSIANTFIAIIMVARISVIKISCISWDSQVGVLFCVVLFHLSWLFYVDLSTCTSLFFLIINLSHIRFRFVQKTSLLIFLGRLLFSLINYCCLICSFLSSENCINNLDTRVNTLQEAVRPHRPENITFLLSHSQGVSVYAWITSRGVNVYKCRKIRLSHLYK